MRIAIIGAGISGLGAAWILRKTHELTVFEAADYAGGHTHTVDVQQQGLSAPVDTGFLVFNDRTYPHLLGLFAELDVPWTASDMSLSVRLPALNLEWCGSSLGTLFAQKRNALRPAFWGMLKDILRFNRAALAWLNQSDADITLGEFLERGAYGEWFRSAYLLPMAAAIWSCPTGTMLAYPARSILTFYRNHGLLQIFNRPQWRTVLGGGREYVQRIIRDLPDLRLNTPVEALRPDRQGGVLVQYAGGREEHFDQVICALHGDQARGLLGEHWPAQKAALAHCQYQDNIAYLHGDEHFLPKRRKAWAAWNFHEEGVADAQRSVAVTYLINQLQPLPFTTPVMVTLNPQQAPDPEKTWAQFHYAHPVFDHGALAGQEAIRRLQGADGLWFCGAWLGHGFHEDGLRSAVEVANRMGIRAAWQQQESSVSEPRMEICPEHALR
ncbi:FAD-dependent oxidoreductase [Acidithiobacillus montserratensis]|uniref:FAD-dependent oxidoreductase n=1 Tax=Acidithiobacillus montserratensis TaxID=2729135 RepID=A0ACD5HGS4_9PROT|nr:FAD-dependent oxidoreductase [Acidithiobacillus montserratensis]MBN2679441.1 FAD-dependent oxidoreductase [Acidithiobacillaceae bacterium]MBU2747176.1 NAD(P)-binding protein [Acidithiobacillus montserratensis]